MDRHPIFFVTDWYIFEVVWWILVRYILVRIYIPVLFLLVITSVDILYLL